MTRSGKPAEHWTEERVALLRRLNALGLSGSKIAKALLMTGHAFKRTAEGVAQPQSQNDYVMSCQSCAMTRGWVRYKDGTEREIPQSVIWGRAEDSAA